MKLKIRDSERSAGVAAESPKKPTAKGSGDDKGDLSSFAAFKKTPARRQEVVTEADLFLPGSALLDWRRRGSPLSASDDSAHIRTPEYFDSSSWDTSPLEPDLIFSPPTRWFASEKANVISSLRPDISHGLAYALMGRIFGFEDWYKLDNHIRKAKRGRFDEELPADRRRLRHQWQVMVLQICAGCTRLDAVGLRLDWQPSSGSMALLQLSPESEREIKRRDARPHSRIEGTIARRRRD